MSQGLRGHDGRCAYNRGTVLIASLLIITLATYGCASMQQSMAESPGKAVALCAGGGALAGAGAGAALDKKNPLRGALIGAAAGILAGGATCFVIAKAGSTPKAGYSETQKAEAYKPAQGAVVRVRHLDIDPASLAPGQKFTWRSEYVVMTPDPDADLELVETRTISTYDEKAKEWKPFNSHSTKITAKPGTREDESELTMPSELKAQKYMVTFQVDYNKASDKKSQEVAVVSRLASAPTTAGQMVVVMQAEEVSSRPN